MVVGAISIALHFEHSRSLKEKRRLLRSIIEKVKHRFNVSVAEIEDQDLWQKATIGIAYVALNQFQAKKQIQEIDKFIVSMNKAVISDFSHEVIIRDV